MNANEYQKLLSKLGACTEARHAADGKSLEEVWTTCERGDWLLWLAAKLDIDRKIIVGACCDCAELALKFVPKNENRPAEAIRIAREWIAGRATIEEVREAAAAAAGADAANAAAAGAASANAAASAYAAAYAANAAASAYAAAYAANAAANAAAYGAASAYAAAYAANAAYAAARKETLAQCAGIVRSKIQFGLILEAAQKRLIG